MLNKYYLIVAALIGAIIIAAYYERATITAIIGIFFAGITIISKVRRKERDFLVNRRFILRI